VCATPSFSVLGFPFSLGFQPSSWFTSIASSSGFCSLTNVGLIDSLYVVGISSTSTTPVHLLHRFVSASGSSCKLARCSELWRCHSSNLGKKFAANQLDSSQSSHTITPCSLLHSFSHVYSKSQQVFSFSVLFPFYNCCHKCTLLYRSLIFSFPIIFCPIGLCLLFLSRSVFRFCHTSF
jgi:hypothetical protein